MPRGNDNCVSVYMIRRVHEVHFLKLIGQFNVSSFILNFALSISVSFQKRNNSKRNTY